jgi:SAM-dependent methyltransferase
VGGDAFYDRPGVAERYDRHRHDSPTSPNILMEQPALLDELGPVRGLEVIDLGCGDAGLARHLLDAGAGCAAYTGVDASAAMLDLARSRLPVGAVRLVRERLEDFDAPDHSADLVVSRMALHYVRDLAAVLAAARRWTRPGGRLVFTVPHPVLTCHDAARGAGGARGAWVVDDYFVAGPRERVWMGGAVTWHHRTVEEYVRALLAAGFALTGLGECGPRAREFAGLGAEYARRRRVPLFLMLAGARPA